MFIDTSQSILVLAGFNRRLLGHFAPTELDKVPEGRNVYRFPSFPNRLGLVSMGGRSTISLLAELRYFFNPMFYKHSAALRLSAIVVV